MTYYRNSRLLGDQVVSSTYLSTPAGTPAVREMKYPTVIEEVYSWRTGSHAVSDPAPSPTTRKSFDDWGIRTPSQKGSLANRIADRTRYYNEVVRAAFPAETSTGSVSTTRASQTDSGHVFSKVTCSRWPLVYHAEVHTSSSPRKTMKGEFFVDGANFTPRVPFGSAGYFSAGVTEESNLSATERQGMMNRYFQSTAPSQQNASIMVTLLELIKGDVPSLLRNFRRSVYKHRATRYLGGEALNITFGWSPIISDYVGMIKTFLAVDRMIYSETNRRHRQWDGPTTTSTTYSPKSLGLTFSGSRGTLVSGDSSMLTTGNFNLEVVKTVSEDYRFSSRYSAIARSTRKSNEFAYRAEETLRQLGLIEDPTLLWELLPWSWLVDWALTMSASITNANLYSPISGKYAVDYAYLTTQSTVVIQERVVSFQKTSGNTNVIDALVPTRQSGYFVSTARTRDRATPFGFGTQLASLNAAQFGILVALGLAKSR